MDGDMLRGALTLTVASGLTVLSAQTPVRSPAEPAPAFEVASIKLNTERPNSAFAGFQQGGRYEAINQPIAGLLTLAYSPVRADYVIGAPEWVFRDRYDVIASAGREASRDEIRIMMRALLADRFKLRAHVEQRDLPIFALVVAREDGRLGPQLKELDVECGVNGAPACGMSASPAGLKAAGAPLSALANLIWISAGRPVFDRTGLVGNYELTLVYRPENGRPRDPSAPPDERPSLVTALQEQLGLRLQTERGLVNHLIIESIERPTEN